MRKVLLLALNDLRLTARDRSSLIWMLMLPLARMDTHIEGLRAQVAAARERADAVAALKARRVGAAVVSTDGKLVAGIISERDIVHGLSELGSDHPELFLQLELTLALVHGLLQLLADVRADLLLRERGHHEVHRQQEAVVEVRLLQDG